MAGKTIDALRRGEKWILITGRRTSTDEITGTPTKHGPARTLFSKCWTGKKWTNVGSFAKEFDSEEEAIKHTQQNLAALSTTQGFS